MRSQVLTRRLLPEEAIRSTPWVLVAGGAYGAQGMDGANAALAEYLLDCGREVHIVAHRIGNCLKAYRNLVEHPVRTPAQSYLLGEMLLDRKGRNVAEGITSSTRGARVIVNGANCLWGDVNWVHSVHNAWSCVDDGAPALFRAKNRLVKFRAKARERAALSRARLLIANSKATKNNIVATLGVPADRIHVVYLGNDMSFGAVTQVERAAARQWLNVPTDRPVAVFVGALSHDNNKGLDTLLEAWWRLTGDSQWDADLMVAGGGSGVARWKTWVQENQLASRIRILGHTERIADLLAAADVLVSPVRYEAYGLNVQEAICRGIPAIVSATAGVAERYPQPLQPMLLNNAGDVNALVDHLRLWRRDMSGWKQRFVPLGETLRSWTWRKMAEEIVRIAE